MRKRNDLLPEKGFPGLPGGAPLYLGIGPRRAAAYAYGGSCLRLFITILVLPLCLKAQTGFKYFRADDTAAAPKLLSQTGLYADIKARRLAAEAARFDVNSPLWSDASVKARWILLKKGTTVAYRELDDYLDYPDSAIFIKQFAIDTVPGDSTSRVLWETRLLINQKQGRDATSQGTDKWFGYSYKWRKDQSDADLVSPGTGANDAIAVHPAGKPAYLKKWRFPSQEDCWKCHVQGAAGGKQARSVLGFFSSQLNGPYWRGGGNQIDSLFARGFLTGAKPADWTKSPRWRAIGDSTATLDVRARSYIGANCSGCHGARGNANHAAAFVAFNYDFHTGVPAEELRDRTVRRTDFVSEIEPVSITPKLIVPHWPQKSLLLYRQTTRDTTPGDYEWDSQQMPPLATYERNQPALDLMSKWILGMDSVFAGVRGGAMARADFAPFILGRRLRLAPALDGSDAPVSLVDFRGRATVLAGIGAGEFAIPAALPPGTYLVRRGAQRALRHLF